jgi:1-acyl-sn-glycerol-3-phosphate acyltransferase
MFQYSLIMTLLITWTGICVPFAILGKLINPAGVLSHHVGRFWSRGILKIARMKLEIEGLDLIDPASQYIFISNHTSAFDIPAIYWGLENKLGMLAKKQLKYVPFFGWAMWAAGHFFVDRHNHKRAMAVMDQVALLMQKRKDHSLVVFVEGTRSLDGELRPFKKGAFVLSLDTGVPVVPVIINGAFKAKSKKSRRIEPTTLGLTILPPMDPGKYSRTERQAFVDDAFALFKEHYISPNSPKD